jgi:hypothetical protein
MYTSTLIISAKFLSPKKNNNFRRSPSFVLERILEFVMAFVLDWGTAGNDESYWNCFIIFHPSDVLLERESVFHGDRQTQSTYHASDCDFIHVSFRSLSLLLARSFSFWWLYLDESLFLFCCLPCLPRSSYAGIISHYHVLIPASCLLCTSLPMLLLLPLHARLPAFPPSS